MSRKTRPDKARRRQFEKLMRRAESRGWGVPGNSDPFGDDVWLRHWQACSDYERGLTKGRPVIPHRSGGGARLLR